MLTDGTVPMPICGGWVIGDAARGAPTGDWDICTFCMVRGLNWPIPAEHVGKDVKWEIKAFEQFLRYQYDQPDCFSSSQVNMNRHSQPILFLNYGAFQSQNLKSAIICNYCLNLYDIKVDRQCVRFWFWQNIRILLLQRCNK